jgi:hypothetical protein
MRSSVFITRVNLLGDNVDQSVFKLRELFTLYSKRLCFTFFEYQEVRSHFGRDFGMVVLKNIEIAKSDNVLSVNFL